jgi:CRP/FNR family transcriptional regulator
MSTIVQASNQAATPPRPTRTASPCDHCTSQDASFCGALEGQAHGRLAAIVTGRSYPARQTIVQEGESAEWLFNVLSGTVKLFRTLPDGRVQIIGFLGEGDFMGLPPAGLYEVSAETVTPVDVCVFPKRSFDRLLGESQALEHRLFAMSRDEVVAAQNHMLLLGRKTAQERVATFLVARVKQPRCGRSVALLDTAPWIDLPMSRMEIADYLGLTMETVSRAFSKFKHQGLIALDGPDRVQLMRLDRLREIAAGA